MTFNKVLQERLQKVTDEYKDTEGVTARELRLYVWFHDMLYGEMLKVGREETGYVFRQSYRGTMLVYKASLDGIPQVAFITGHNPVQCMQIFCRQFYDETIDWVKDKYG